MRFVVAVFVTVLTQFCIQLNVSARKQHCLAKVNFARMAGKLCEITSEMKILNQTKYVVQNIYLFSKDTVPSKIRLHR
jgi:hypothetical protein